MSDDRENELAKATRERATVTRERTLDATPAEVWATLTDEFLLAQWLAAEVEFDPREGGDARFEFEDGERREAEVDTVEPHERLAWTWQGDGDDTGRVELRLVAAEAGRTRLIVIESCPVSSSATFSPWGPALTSLATMHSNLVCA